MPDSSHNLDWIDDQLRELQQRGLRRTLTERTAEQGPILTMAGRQVINFGSNDYLGLAADPRLVEAVRTAMDRQGWGAGASPLIAGRSSLHAQLERRLAEFKQCEAALLFPSGFAANAGVVPALMGRGDAIFSDAKNHASLIDGCRLSRAETFVYPHRDAAALARLIEQSGERRRRIIVTDSLFSMDGDLAPLPELADVAQRYEAMLMVDEAHATGVWGDRGSGLVEHYGLESRVAVRVGTLSKALGAAGGFVAGSQKLIDYLANRARSYVFSTAMPAANCAAALTALDVVRDEPDRRQRVLELAEELRTALIAQGWNVGDSQSQIVPIVLGDIPRTMAAAARLRDAGLLVPAIRPPTVPQDESLLRVSLAAGHTRQQVEQLVDSLGTQSPP